MSKIRLINGCLVDIDFTGIRLVNGYLIIGVPGSVQPLTFDADSTFFGVATSLVDLKKQTNSSVQSTLFNVDSSLIDGIKKTTSTIASSAFSTQTQTVKLASNLVSTIDSGSFHIGTDELDSLKHNHSPITSAEVLMNVSNAGLSISILSSISSSSLAVSGSSIDSLKHHLTVTESGAFVLNLAAVNNVVINVLTSQANNQLFTVTPNLVQTVVQRFSPVLSSDFSINAEVVGSNKGVRLSINSGEFSLAGDDVSMLYKRLTVFESGAFSLKVNDVNTLATTILGWLDGVVDVRNSLDARSEIAPVLKANIEVNHYA